MQSSVAALMSVGMTGYLLLVGSSVVGTSVRAYSAGPDPALTGAFEEITCNQSGCHNSFDLNAGRALGLEGVVIEGFPERRARRDVSG